MMKRYLIINILLLPTYISTIIAGTMGLSTFETKHQILTVGLLPAAVMSILISGLMNGMIYLGQRKHGDSKENKRTFRTCASIIAVLYFIGLLITTFSMY
ncbi:hypothetical protein [Neobacillus niacini]|uniref:hypothetical protein n=1 Tax=Neobacillus niacini TaxID=86668 RepID=UPI003983758C